MFLQLITLLIGESAPSIEIANKDISMLTGMSLTTILDKLIKVTVDFAFKLAIAFVVFYIGKFLINKLYKITKAIMVRRKVELSLATFILSLLKITLLFLLIVIVIGILGIETSSFIAIFASAGVAIGMALSGTLQNFAGGVLILLIKPYKVGDYIEVQDYSGTVKEIQIFYTILNTIDNKAIILPNGTLSTGTINNYSKEEYRRVDWIVGISYGDDFELAKKTAINIMLSDKRIVKKFIKDENKTLNAVQESKAENVNENEDEKKSIFKRLFHKRHKVAIIRPSIPNVELVRKSINAEPFVTIKELAESSVNIEMRAWTKSSNYWDVYYSINEKIYQEFPKVGLNFPFPQMDIHIDKQI